VVTEDLILVKQIFELVDSGIKKDYQSFCYEVDLGLGYMETSLSISNEEGEETSVHADLNSAILYDLVEKLRENAIGRGEGWASFVMTYKVGGEVKTKFKY
jgi:hypothetical protein